MSICIAIWLRREKDHRYATYTNVLVSRLLKTYRDDAVHRLNGDLLKRKGSDSRDDQMENKQRYQFSYRLELQYSAVWKSHPQNDCLTHVWRGGKQLQNVGDGLQSCAQDWRTDSHTCVSGFNAVVSHSLWMWWTLLNRAEDPSIKICL